MPDDLGEECPNTLLPKAICDHCRPPAPRGLIPDSEVLARFAARFDKEGGCEYCGGDTTESEPLCLTEADGWVHEEHCEPKPDPGDTLSLR